MNATAKRNLFIVIAFIAGAVVATVAMLLIDTGDTVVTPPSEQEESNRGEPLLEDADIKLPEGAGSLLPDSWRGLTAEEKTELNPFACLHESDISEVDGRCLTDGGVEYIQLLRDNGFDTWFSGEVVMAVPPETSRSQFDDLFAHLKEHIEKAHFAFLLDIYSYKDVTYDGARWKIVADDPLIAYELEGGRQILDTYLQNPDYTARQKTLAMSSYCHLYGHKPSEAVEATEGDMNCVKWHFVSSSYYGGCGDKEHSVNDHACGDLLAYERWSAMEAEIKGDAELRDAYEERLATYMEIAESSEDRSDEERAAADAVYAEMQAIVFTSNSELRVKHGLASVVFGGPNITAVFIR